MQIAILEFPAYSYCNAMAIAKVVIGSIERSRNS